MSDTEVSGGGHRNRRAARAPLALLAVVALALGGSDALAGARVRASRSHGASRRTHAARPVLQTAPSIYGTAQLAGALAASPGTWSPTPTSYRFRWLRCNSAGEACRKIRGATSSSYTPGERDVGSRLKVAVRAYVQSRRSALAQSAATAAVARGGPVSHLEYVLIDGIISVYDMDHGFALVKSIVLPQTGNGVRGVTVDPASRRMFVSHGGDGPVNGTGNGSVLAYDLVTGNVVWEVALNTGIDSGMVSPDGSTIYMPTGENTETGIWNLLSAKSGKLLGTIQGGAGAHNTIVSSDGRYVYLGGRNHSYLDVYETATGKVFEVGPLAGGVRPFTVNGSSTLAFTTATGYDGFQVLSLASHKVLYSESFGQIPNGFPYTTGSHGIALSPDEKQLYVVDSVHKEVQVWNVAGAKQGVAPTPLGTIALAGLSGEESGCAYDCGRSGWLQLSRDGRYLFAGDSGEVIETATRKVLGTLPTLAQSKVSIEIDWEGGVPVATSGRSGVGDVP
jgi:DNA-binding beta-propeller fold protein YncE